MAFATIIMKMKTNSNYLYKSNKHFCFFQIFAAETFKRGVRPGNPELSNPLARWVASANQ